MLRLLFSHFSRVWLFMTLWIVACQTPLSMGFSRQEYWSRLSCPPPGDIPDPGMETPSLASLIAGRFFSAEPPGKPTWFYRSTTTQEEAFSNLWSLPEMSWSNELAWHNHWAQYFYLLLYLFSYGNLVLPQTKPNVSIETLASKTNFSLLLLCEKDLHLIWGKMLRYHGNWILC